MVFLWFSYEIGPAASTWELPTNRPQAVAEGAGTVGDVEGGSAGSVAPLAGAFDESQPGKWKTHRKTHRKSKWKMVV